MAQRNSELRETIERKIDRLKELKQQRADINAHILSLELDPIISEHQMVHDRIAMGLIDELKERDIPYSELRIILPNELIPYYVSRLRRSGMITQEPDPTGPENYFLRITKKGLDYKYLGEENGR